MGLYDFTLYDVIVRNAQLYQDSPAWLDDGRGAPVTFGRMKREVDRLAGALQTSGCQKGDRIGVLGKNCLAYFVIYGAAAALGAIVVPVNWRLSADEAAFILKDGAPHCIFADDSNPQWTEAVRSKLSGDLPFYNLQPGTGSYDTLPVGEHGAGLVPPPVSGDDGFVMIHTAAVAGRPRGAVLSQNNLLCAHMHLAHALGLSTDDVHLNALPLFHVAGLFMAFFAFHGGCLNVNLAKFDAPRMVELISEHNASFTFTFAPMLKSLLDAQVETRADIGSLRAVMGLDAPEVIDRYQETAGGTFYCMYGQTETSMLASLGRYNDAPGSAGRPIMLGAVQLMDDDDRPVSGGDVGEIALRGPMVFKGYWGLEEDNRYTFRNGWHHTGDLGRMDGAGFLWYAGRKADKELIKPGGENVYPAEVEKAVLEHPEVEAVVVFGVPDPKWKEGIKAVCVLSQGAGLTAGALIDFVGQRIARYKKPQYVEFVGALPLTSGGAVDREKVKEIYGGDQVK
jgi:long-chain acyl-CoA synthetase